MHIPVYICLFNVTYVCIHIYIHICVCMFACVFVRVYVYDYIGSMMISKSGPNFRPPTGVSRAGFAPKIIIIISIIFLIIIIIITITSIIIVVVAIVIFISIIIIIIVVVIIIIIVMCPCYGPQFDPFGVIHGPRFGLCHIMGLLWVCKDSRVGVHGQGPWRSAGVNEREP